MAQEPIDFTWLANGLSAFAGGSAVFLSRIFFDRKKLKSENLSAELDSDTKAVELYERFSAQLNPRIEALQSKVETLNEQVVTLKEENLNLRIENREHKLENSKLKEEMKVMHTQITELKSRIK